MKKNIIIGSIVVLVAVASFYGGMVYGKNNGATSNFSQNSAQGRGGMAAGVRRGGGQAGGGMVNGSLLSQDDKSLTVKLSDGGSKIIFLSSSTQMMKMASTSKDKLVAGDNLVIVGTANTDGSVAAQSVQIRPAGAFGSGGQK